MKIDLFKILTLALWSNLVLAMMEEDHVVPDLSQYKMLSLIGDHVVPNLFQDKISHLRRIEHQAEYEYINDENDEDYSSDIDIQDRRIGCRNIDIEDLRMLKINQDLIRAINRKDSRKVKVLLENGANPNTSNGQKTALIIALNNSCERIAKILIQAGANVNMKSKFDETALMTVYNQSTLKMILDAGAFVNLQDNSGNTALMYIVQQYYNPDVLDMVKTLINYGADVNLKNCIGKKALDIIYFNTNDKAYEIINLIRAYTIDCDVALYQLIPRHLFI